MRTIWKALKVLPLSVLVIALAVPGWTITPNPDGNPHGTDILLWHMDNATGSTWTDSASGSMNGVGSATSVQGLFRAPGAAGLGAGGSFPDGGIVSPAFASAKGHEFTLECWICWPTGTNPQAANQLIAERRSANDLWYLKANVMSTGGIADTIEWAAWTSPTSTTVNSGVCHFQNNVWYHVAVTCQHIATDNNTIRIYCTPSPAPGVQIGPPVLMTTATGVHDMPATTGTNFRVGGGVTGGMAGRNFDGYIDEVKLSSTALTSFDSFLPSPGDAVYDIHSLSESQLMDLYTAMLIDGARYSDASWHTYSVGGYWGDGSTDGNSGIRAVACMVLTCGTLLKYCDSLTPADRANFLVKSIDALRFMTATHVTGTEHCTDGKKWGNAWGSAYCTGIFGLGARLIWDDLDSGLKADLERVIGYEADRFLTVNPPSGSYGDTKAEENAWNQYGISAAAYLFPANPHAAAWDDKSIQYAMNTLSVAQDEQDSTVVDGKTVSEWVCTENLHPDFTLENHNIFHPSYMQCSTYLLFPAMMHCILSGQPVPQGLKYHTLDLWGVFKTLLLSSGETIFPQGMDWEMHNLPAINLFGTLATYFDDPVAAEAEKTILQYMRAWQQWQGGSLTVPGSTWGFTRHSIQCEQTATAYLAHKFFGPATSDPAPPPADSVVYYSYVQDLLHRTQSKLLSFSWRNRIMGMLVPLGAGHESCPFFTVPTTNGFVGSTTLNSGGTAVTVSEHAWRTTSSGCETSGTLLTNSGLLKQDIKVTSVGQKTVVYQDLVTAQSDVIVTKELGLPIGIENDSISGGTRVLSHRDGAVTFDWRSPRSTAVIPGSWANVDGRLGVVSVVGSGIAYTQATGYTSGIAVYTDVLYGSYSTTSRSFSAGQQVARRVLILCTEVTPEETAALAQSATLEDTPSGQVLRFTLPEGGQAEVSLNLELPTVAPDTATVAVHGSQQFTFSSGVSPISWQVINESTPGVGIIDSSGLFTGGVVGTCQIRATDAQGNTDDSGTITVLGGPTFSPTAALRVVRWNKVALTFGPAVGDVTWQVINGSGSGGTIGSVDSNGVFTGMAVGTCQVCATDGIGNTGVSGLITVVPPGPYTYTADADTTALYHFDEATGTTWADSSGSNLNLNAANASTPPSHIPGVFGNAVGEFRWDATSESRGILAGPTPLLKSDELTVEAWIYFPADVDILAATNSIRGIASYRNGSGTNTWSFTAGFWSTGYGVPGGLTFVFWGSPANEFIWTPNRVFYNNIWYHVAATIKKLDTNPVTYEMRLYATPQGVTTPQLVASKITSNRITTTGSDVLYVGHEGGNTSRKFPGYIDELRISRRARAPEELSWSLGGIPAQPLSIGQAKSEAADGTCVSLTGTISADLPNCRYLEAIDRSAGLKLDTGSPLGVGLGDVALVAGELGTVGGERYLKPFHAEKLGELAGALAPLGMTNKSAGGGEFGLQPGVNGDTGLNAFGQLVRVWGKWRDSGNDARGPYFEIDDGSAVAGADGQVGIRVYYAGALNPTGHNVAVTGVLIPVTDTSSRVVRGILPTAEIRLTN